MTWTIPLPTDLSDRASAVYEQSFEGCDARSANSMFTVSARVAGMLGFDCYLFQARLAAELMPDTAVDWLPRHGSIWGVPQGQPAAAAGTLLFQANDGVVIPAGVQLNCPAGVIVQTASAVTVASGAQANVPVTAITLGSLANLPPGTVFTLVSPLNTLNSQEAAVVADANGNGLTGGLDLQSVPSWRAAILARIADPPQGGALSDYVAWVQTVLPGALVNVVANYSGPGSVGVIVAAPGPAAASAAQITAIETYIAGVRPVTAQVSVVAATLVPVNFNYALNPDTVAVQTDAADALALWMAQDAKPGATLYMSRADNAVSSASGCFSLERAAPTADVAFSSAECPVLGSLTWT